MKKRISILLAAAMMLSVLTACGAKTESGSTGEAKTFAPSTEVNWIVTSMLLSYVLSPIFEGNMRKAFIISGGNPMVFFADPVSAAFMGITILLVCSPMFKKIIRKAKGNKAKA